MSLSVRSASCLGPRLLDTADGSADANLSTTLINEFPCRPHWTKNTREIYGQTLKNLDPEVCSCLDELSSMPMLTEPRISPVLRRSGRTSTRKAPIGVSSERSLEFMIKTGSCVLGLSQSLRLILEFNRNPACEPTFHTIIVMLPVTALEV